MNPYLKAMMMAAGAGAEMLAPDEAQAWFKPGLGLKVEDAIRKHYRGKFFAGGIPESAKPDLENILGPEYGKDLPTDVYLNGHVDSRYYDVPESVLSPYLIGKSWERLLSEDAGVRGARNTNTQYGVPVPEKRGEGALFVMPDGREITTPFGALKLRREMRKGKPYSYWEGKTLIEMPNGRLKQHLKDSNWNVEKEAGWLPEGRVDPHVGYAPGQFGEGIRSQRTLSAVGVSPFAYPIAAQEGFVNRTSNNPYMAHPQNSYGQQFRLGTRAVLEGLGELPHSLLNRPVNGVFGTNLRNPGEGLADYFGLPKPQAGTPEETRANIQRGMSAALGDVMTGRGVATLPAKFFRQAGNFMASSPGGQATVGGILGAMAPGGLKAPDDIYGDGILWHLGLAE